MRLLSYTHGTAQLEKKKIGDLRIVSALFGELIIILVVQQDLL
jgi:hypothetical protein